MPFDPDEYLKKKGAFDPNKYLVSKGQASDTAQAAQPSPAQPQQPSSSYWERVAQQFSVPGNTLNEALRQIPGNPVAGVANIGNAFAQLPSAVLSPLTAANIPGLNSALSLPFDVAKKGFQLGSHVIEQALPQSMQGNNLGLSPENAQQANAAVTDLGSALALAPLAKGVQSIPDMIPAEAPMNLMKKALGVTKSDAGSYAGVDRIAKRALNERITKVTPKQIAKQEGRIDQINEIFDKATEAGKARGDMVDVSKMKQALDDLYTDRLAADTEVSKVKGMIDDAKSELDKHPWNQNGQIPLDKAREIKSRIYSKQRYNLDASRTLAKDDIEKAQARNIKDQTADLVNDLFPDLRALGQEDAARIELVDAFKNKLNRMGMKNPSLFREMAIFHWWKGKGIVFDELMKSPRVKSAIAIAMDRAKKLKGASPDASFVAPLAPRSEDSQ